MQLEHEFTVPVPVETAWQALLDPERVAPCMPGATLKSVQDGEFSGSVKVKLGPVSLLYKGNGRFAEVDHETHRAVLEASGKDSRGNGTAAATVRATLRSEGESTAVHVDTDLKVTGKPAQLGRGLISDVAQRLIDQFAQCLAERLTGSDAAEAAGDGQQQAAGTVGGASVSPDGEAGQERSAPTRAEWDSGAPDERTPWRVTGAEGESSREGASSERPQRERHGAGLSGSARRAGEAEQDVVDLLGTAGVPVLKRLVPVALATAVLVVVLVVWRRRTHRMR
ncbi:SRPBCC family protein [Actinopolyspora mortivallis]|uniref:Carbon monoxide dehydrogenase n=1 Tax=Actinopolyspora mortivallis TaxID=33906 RepID=A0A2T0GWQ1_ACTMO|nr:SRPBCC family protein [Actinopolyspora mortivallis]PRW63545.1 carbon monoxide dehydrogenase [Actinopolyspora mortivallis]